MRFLQVFIVLLGLMMIPPAWAQDDAGPYVHVRVLPERGTIQPGEEIWIGIEQSIAPGWHTYWKNPGDSGSAPRVQWVLPEGFEVGEIQWPVPFKLPYGPLMNYGYSSHVILLQKLKAPDELPGRSLTLSADIEVLVCKEECIPEFGTYNIVLNGPESGTEDNSDYLSTAVKNLPLPGAQSATFEEKDGNLRIVIPDKDASIFKFAMPGSFELFPEDWGLVSNTAAMEAKFLKTGALEILQKRGDRALSALDETGFIVTYRSPDGSRQTVRFAAHKVGAAAKPADAAGATTFWQALLLAVLGGLVLNLMPCVFPVLSIKALSLIKTSEKSPKLAKLHGLSYTAGIILCFLLIAGLLIAFKAGGAAIGWGFQLQNPVVVTLLAYLLFVIGLNLLGFFEVNGKFMSFGGKFAQGQDLTNSFAAGILATLVATPCTAPFMAAALGYALIKPPVVALSVFVALGFGLALPYLLLSFIPVLQKRLPKPGPWMDKFKKILAVPMFASSIWLVWVLSQQAGMMGVTGALIGMAAIAFGLYLIRHIPVEKSRKRLVVKTAILLAFLMALAFLPVRKIEQPQAIPVADAGFGEKYSPEILAAALMGDAPVFVEMTAAWCITCKVNHAVAINIESTRNLFAERGVRYLIGDWTNQDPQITEFLTAYGRSGVPIYVYYGPRPRPGGERPEPEVLPQILTPGMVQDIIER